jgi:hypothetical protein
VRMTILSSPSYHYISTDENCIARGEKRWKTLLTHDVLVVIRAARAVGAHEAIGVVAGIALVGVDLQFALGQLEVVLGNDLVEREFTTAHQLARAAVAEDVLLLGDFGGPGDLPAVALSFVLRHCAG